MEQDEVRGMVWEELARSPSSVSAKEIAVSCGLGLSQVHSAIQRLRQSRLIEIATPLPETTYLPSIRLDAMRWAQALELGIPLTVLERYARLSSADRADALRVATDGTIEREAAKHEQAKRRAKHELLEGRAATRVAATDLARIEEDARRALGASNLDPAAESILRQVQQQASIAVERLRQSLIAGGKA